MNTLEHLIRVEIKERGPMTFARYMELALYHPEWGYYARENVVQHIGSRGDFYTSVSVGPLFARLLAHQFAQWWEAMGRPHPFQLVEFGGFDGQLAQNILTTLQNDFPECADSVQYIFVEPFSCLKESQKQKVAAFPGTRWVVSLGKLETIEGIVFGNEFLDAFPLHLLEYWVTDSKSAHGSWHECRISLEKETLTWTHEPASKILVADIPEHASGKVEVCPQAVHWLTEVSSRLKHGYVLLLDYGWTDEEYFQIKRPNGTVRGYSRHHLVKDMLANPGEQDITAHVRWTPLLAQAKHLKLRHDELIQQGRWLSRIVAQSNLKLNRHEVRQFNNLTHPEIMGTSFRVLVLSRLSEQ